MIHIVEKGAIPLCTELPLLCWIATVLEGLFREYHSSSATLGQQGPEITRQPLVRDWLAVEFVSFGMVYCTGMQLWLLLSFQCATFRSWMEVGMYPCTCVCAHSFSSYTTVGICSEAWWTTLGLVCKPTLNYVPMYVCRTWNIGCWMHAARSWSESKPVPGSTPWDIVCHWLSHGAIRQSLSLSFVVLAQTCICCPRSCDHVVMCSTCPQNKRYPGGASASVHAHLMWTYMPHTDQCCHGYWCTEVL